MPASHAAIAKNIERLKDQALIDLWNQEATEERTPGQAWAAFVEASDNLRLADKIPGSVGRSFKKRYADEAMVEAALPKKATETSGPEPGPKAPRARKAVSRPAPASAGSMAGGSGRSRSKAAQAAQKEAAK